MKNTGLGRGLGALLGDEPTGESGSGGGLKLLIARVEPNAAQPRRTFDEAALNELAESIRQHGVLQPLLVRKLDTGYFQIIAGERRWRAARMAGLVEIPAIVVDADDRHATELALIENLQREDLNPMEEAEGLRLLIEEYGLTQEEVAQRIGRSRPAVTNHLRLLTLPPRVRELVVNGALTAGHARAVLAAGDDEKRQEAAELAVERGLSVRETELLARRLSKPPARKKSRAPNYLLEHEQRLSRGLGRKVTIVGAKKKGSLILEFYDPEDLEQLMTQLEGLYS